MKGKHITWRLPHRGNETQKLSKSNAFWVVLNTCDSVSGHETLQLPNDRSMKWTTKWLSFICSQSCVYVINATVTVAGSHGVAPSRPKRRKPTNDKLMTQQTTLQKIRFENGLAVAKSKIEYVMCRIEEIRLQLQGKSRLVGATAIV